MKIIVKKLQGDECSLEVVPMTRISDIKRLISGKLGIPMDEQKLLLMGRTLADEQTVQSYPGIKEGTRLNLVVKKPEGLFEVAVKYFKKQGMSDTEATNAGKRLIRIVQEKFNKLSWDDVDRLCLDCMLDESGQSRSAADPESECDDTFSL